MTYYAEHKRTGLVCIVSEPYDNRAEYVTVTAVGEDGPETWSFTEPADHFVITYDTKEGIPATRTAIIERLATPARS